jgi:hypothetical protein
MDRFASSQVRVFQGSSWRAGVKRSIQMNSAAINNVFLYTMIWHLLIMSCPMCFCILWYDIYWSWVVPSVALASLLKSICYCQSQGLRVFDNNNILWSEIIASYSDTLVWSACSCLVVFLWTQFCCLLPWTWNTWKYPSQLSVIDQKSSRCKKIFNQTSGSTHVLINDKYFSGELSFFKDRKIARNDCSVHKLTQTISINTDPLGDERFWRWWEAKVALTQIKWISIYVETSSLKPDFYKFTLFQHRDQINLWRRWFEKKESEGARNCYFTWDKGLLWEFSCLLPVAGN